MRKQLPSYQLTHLPISSPSIFSTCLVMTSCCATVVSLCSPVTTRGIDPAMSWRARAPAVTTNSKELESFDLSIIFYLCAGRSLTLAAPITDDCLLYERTNDAF